jgi:uncharacterized SAM-binding protein YcdF (DUF218 family)
VFLLKKVLGGWLMPLPFSATLLVAGLLLRLAGRLRAGRVVCYLSIGTAFLATLGVTGDGLLWGLERRYPAVVDAASLPVAPDYIVVLGSGYRPREGLPITSALDASALVRLVEGVRLSRQLPAASLVLSGGAVNGQPASARGYERAAIELGVPPEAIIIIDDPLDTGAEIRALRRRLGGARILLVTSASHMPRAMAHCERNGMHATAAPTGHSASPPSTWGIATWLMPSGVQLRKTETALHEYLGLLALRVGLL